MRGGDPGIYAPVNHVSNVLPACAGVIPEDFLRVRAGIGITRMRGGDPKTTATESTSYPYYPHARG